ncbi:MAG: GTPase [Acidimicrobiales bacterium]
MTPVDVRSTLMGRVDALEQAVAMAEGRFHDADVAAARVTVDRARARLRHGTHHTVVAIAGATGSGKSSIVNRVAGTDVTNVGVLRPTTSVPHAVVWGDADAGPLLDWLEIRRRHEAAASADESAHDLDGLVLLDLPDHDSTAVEHRLEVDRLVELVDVLVWVTDPQKYADEAMHVGYLQPLAEHHSILRFVLNQIDRVTDPAVVAADLERLLADDGLAGAKVVSVSAVTGEGLPEVSALLADAVRERRAALDRLDVDVRQTAMGLHRSGSPDEQRSHRRDLVDGLAEAAGSAQVADVAGRHHRRQGSLAMGWPFTRFVRRLARRPLADLPGPGRSSASAPRVDLALRDYAEAVADDLEVPWPGEVRRVSSASRDDLIDDVRRTIGTTAVGAGKPARWWTPVVWLQGVLATVAVVGLVWLLVVAALGGFLRFDTEPLLPDTPRADWIPLPSALLLGGALLGLLIAFIVRIPLAIGAGRRARAARKTMADQLESLAESHVVEPVAAVLAEHRRLDELLSEASG